MGKHVGISLILIVVIFLGAWLWGGPGVVVPEEEPTLPVETGEPEESEEKQAETTGADAGQTLRVLLDGTLTEMNMGEYLRGVVRA